jgi:hypothetical protein
MKLCNRLSMIAMRAAGQLYQAMASIEESQLDQAAGKEMVAATSRSLSELKAGRRYLQEALDLIPELVEFLRTNWDEGYEAQLRDTGFRGSLFILRDYKIYLEAVLGPLDAQIEFHDGAVNDLKKGGAAEQDSIFRPLLHASTRGMCRALLRFLDWEEEMAQTQVVNITRFAGGMRA